MEQNLKQDLVNLPILLADTLTVAQKHLEGLDHHPAGRSILNYDPQTLQQIGIGGKAALAEFENNVAPLLSGSPGPRYFGFVTGGATPASIMGDWLSSTYDQNTMMTGETGSPFVEFETVNLLKQLLDLPAEFTGNFTTGATMASFSGLATARQVLLKKKNWLVNEQGLFGAPKIRVLSGTAHSSIVKCLSMLGMGYQSLEKVATIANTEEVDLSALEAALKADPDTSTIIVANAGTVNRTDFDKLDAIADLAQNYGAWLHVDGAFGAFAKCLKTHAHLVSGLERADSITIDAHKWLNVPYDSGIVLTRSLTEQIETFQNFAPYLGAPTVRPENYLHMTPENSRRFRALPLWFALKAYGRDGIADIIERNCQVAKYLGDKIKTFEGFELIEDPKLNVVAFKLISKKAKKPLDFDATKAYLNSLTKDGVCFLSPSLLHGEAICRIAVSNWRTGLADADATFASMTKIYNETEINYEQN